MFTYVFACVCVLPRGQVEQDTKIAKDRIDLAKALIRASDKPVKPKKSNKDEKDPNTASAEAKGPTTSQFH